MSLAALITVMSLCVYLPRTPDSHSLNTSKKLLLTTASGQVNNREDAHTGGGDQHLKIRCTTPMLKYNPCVLFVHFQMCAVMFNFFFFQPFQAAVCFQSFLYENQY